MYAYIAYYADLLLADRLLITKINKNRTGLWWGGLKLLLLLIILLFLHLLSFRRC